jgi:hypothetical protein
MTLPDKSKIQPRALISVESQHESSKILSGKADGVNNVLLLICEASFVSKNKRQLARKRDSLLPIEGGILSPEG